MPTNTTVVRRLGVIGVCVVSVLVCCGLAWWQWGRFASSSGTFQNLGYVLQWPLFGFFPAFMFWRIRKLRQQEQQHESVADEARGDEDGEQRVSLPAPHRASVTPEPVAVDTSEPDEELAAYNRYLAELHARDQQQSR